ncbi:MAG: AMP-binding protein [Muribaculaceae bacterium]|nr:AMP-binding protein [Muribaculaceae bacterium]
MTPLLKIYEQSFRENYELPALSDFVSGKTVTYGEFALKIARIHVLYKSYGICKGDKIALLGKNTPEWVAVFMATLTYGAVVVPILNDFNPADAQHIVNHSDAELLFVNDSIFEHMEGEKMPKVRAVVSLDRKAVLYERAPEGRRISFASAIKGVTRRLNKQYPGGFSAQCISYPEMQPDDLAIINYTSGTTGFSKGVMLTHANLGGNVTFGIESKLHYKGSRALSFLPLAHAYGCAFDMLTPLAVGSHVTILGKTPTPAVLLKAFAQVKPSLIICVPLILEKIYKKMIVPMITSAPLRWVLAVPLLDMAVYSRIRNRLIEAFGGEFEEVIVGGAPLNPEVEQFLHKIKFPFTVGYGMTECGPLISYTPWREFIPTSSGHTLRGFMTAKTVGIEGMAADANGEILVKGTNVMKGYYKNPEATAQVLEPDGWLHTGDMGYLGGDDGQTIFIRGRYKTMILSANGQNIYPEEIEAKLNNMPYVAESLIVDRGGRLTALVYPDTEQMDQSGLTLDQTQKLMNDTILRDLNKLVAPYEQVERIQVVPQEFEKTPKRSIKRFLYT